MLRVIRFWHDDQGATAIEYALLASLFAIAAIAAASALGEATSEKYGYIDSSISGAIDGAVAAGS